MRNFVVTNANGLMKISEAIRFAQFHFNTSWSNQCAIQNFQEKRGKIRKLIIKVLYEIDRRITWLYKFSTKLRNEGNQQLGAQAEDFQHDAKNWITLFLTPSEDIPNTRRFKKSLYQPDNMTPYIHVLVHHIPEFMAIHQKWGFKAFSCSSVKKKPRTCFLFFS
jgi:hypothetical protein